MASNLKKWSAEFLGTFWLTFGVRPEWLAGDRWIVVATAQLAALVLAVVVACIALWRILRVEARHAAAAGPRRCATSVPG